MGELHPEFRFAGSCMLRNLLVADGFSLHAGSAQA
jgi:hypothetical protein